MARMKASPEVVAMRLALSRRLILLRAELCRRHRHEHGTGSAAGALAQLCTRLGTCTRTWYGHERGSAMAPELLLRLIVQEGVSPLWFLTGCGPMFDPQCGYVSGGA